MVPAATQLYPAAHLALHRAMRHPPAPLVRLPSLLLCVGAEPRDHSLLRPAKQAHHALPVSVWPACRRIHQVPTDFLSHRWHISTVVVTVTFPHPLNLRQFLSSVILSIRFKLVLYDMHACEHCYGFLIERLPLRDPRTAQPTMLLMLLLLSRRMVTS